MELATAWVRLVPSVEGVTDSVTKAFAPGQKAAEDAGGRAGAGWSSKVKGAIGVAAIVAGVVTTFKKLYEVGAVFDDVTDTIRIGTGAQGEALDGLVDVAKNVGRNVPVEFDKIGPVVADLNTRLGLTGDTLQTVSAQYLEAGRILGEDVDIKKTTAAFSAFRIEGEQVESAMDTLFQVSQATGVGINELATNTANAAPMVQNLGFTFEDTAALIGTLDKAGLNANKMLTTLGPGLVNMSKDGEQPAEVFPGSSPSSRSSSPPVTPPRR
ncbi:phage tail tape measure protein [Microbacterium sp. NIBRBAC000506063]|uniref:phage tail tape measure protein n=1 Tax=Microbacterium sp. NIBRBAC000506063 TaxID=2734618 RepID=UPI001BB4D924|nr:phage tail tape measure protein [Microbacterium sp. NIBRBAC000506063]QTV79489.1 phage tail tape measure protein [Microbacterium sp. NIBRBAC000506063]